MERLETADLVIRPPAVEDAPEALELLRDPDVRRWNPAREREDCHIHGRLPGDPGL